MDLSFPGARRLLRIGNRRLGGGRARLELRHRRTRRLELVHAALQPCVRSCAQPREEHIPQQSTPPFLTRESLRRGCAHSRLAPHAQADLCLARNKRRGGGLRTRTCARRLLRVHPSEGLRFLCRRARQCQLRSMRLRLKGNLCRRLLLSGDCRRLKRRIRRRRGRLRRCGGLSNARFQARDLLCVRSGKKCTLRRSRLGQLL
mmetsp:Transcript_7649/g.18415  ORF Transcript_7649/g.18415 Transcript_7649/m.18415 type:complete len:203 (-) Transcript_7649:616-1224(-)